ncbi:hypothetical protein NPIL_134201 [Nephila pilipes]|uniref:Uncharacterized protein n=1 Tax=Nephila pilipes TaxID=299642 RepID=A0A8X6UCV4_NEPPI|nr:hypothetical protein NPIL_134201 [Nephila pilipes]
MKRMANPPNMSTKRVCFNKDAKLDSSFSDSAVTPHHFHLGQDIYAVVTYFATSVQVHLRQYTRDENNRLYPTKKGVFESLVGSKPTPAPRCFYSSGSCPSCRRLPLADAQSVA